MTRTLQAHPERVDAARVIPTTVTPAPDARTIEVMAKSSGRTVAAQRAYLNAQATQNNAYASLFQAGHRYDGAYFDASNRLVLQTDPASPAGRAAAAKGLTVRKARFGEARLNAAVDRLTSAVMSKKGVVSIAPDLAADRVILTVHGTVDPAVRAEVAKLDGMVTIKQGALVRANSTVHGGDKISMASGGYCSAGFPAETDSGDRVMIWAGHCVEDQKTFYKGATKIGTFAGTAFTSYDGKDDYDIGAVWIDDEDTMSSYVNKYGTSWITDATRGTWKAPVGTDLCKSGATSGITCGRMRSYNNSVTYSDDEGRTVASVRGLAETTVCTASGDSGGAYTSGGYAVGMTSGGPSDQECSWNGGYLSGKSSYMQPVTDALSYYGLTYG